MKFNENRLSACDRDLLNLVSEPPTAAESAWFNDWLLHSPGKRDIRSLVALDGFFTALLAGPVPPDPEDFLAVIIGDDAPEMDEDAYSLWFRRLLCFFHRAGRELYKAEEYAPLLDAGIPGPAGHQAWCRGFMIGVALYREAWAPLLADQPLRAAIIPAMYFAGDEVKPVLHAKMSPAETAAKMREWLPDSIRQMARYWHAPKERRAPNRTRDARPPGRNDPCSCGSGKKFKKCCGS